MTNKHHQIARALERLVHHRFNLDSLNKAISDILGKKVSLELGRLDIEDEPDWCYMWNSEKKDTYGYYDIYVLKHRNVDWNGNDLYVTEVGYEFENL